MKKTLLLSLILSCILTHAFGQDKKLRFGISFKPNYSSRFILADSNFNTAKKILNDAETGKLSYSAGLFAERLLDDDMRIQVGVNYMNTGFRTHRKQLLWGSTNGQPDTIGLPEGYFVFNHNRIEIPIDFQYFIESDKPFFVTVGISPTLNVSVTTTSKFYYPDGHREINRQKDTQDGYPKFGLSFKIGLGYQFIVFKKIVLDIQPNVQCFLTTLGKFNPRFNSYLYNAGIQISLKI